MANKKEERKARQAAREATGQTEAPKVRTVTAKVKSPAVVQAEAALAKAKADAAEARKVERAERAKAKAEPRPTCTGTKKDGTKCTAKAKTGTDKCVDHQPAWERLTEDERTVLADIYEALDPEQAARMLVEQIGWHAAKKMVAEQHEAGQ